MAQSRADRPLLIQIQDVYKFDDRRIVAGRIESGHLAAGDEIVIMPAGKIAKIRSVERDGRADGPGRRAEGRAARCLRVTAVR